MRRAVCASVVVLAAMAASAKAEVRATFLGDAAYGTSSACAKLAKLAAGKVRNLETVPELLTARGYESWEGACTIERIVPHRSFGRWTVDLVCHEGAQNNIKRSEVWTRRGDALMVTYRDKTETYQRCETPRARGK